MSAFNLRAKRDIDLEGNEADGFDDAFTAESESGAIKARGNYANSKLKDWSTTKAVVIGIVIAAIGSVIAGVALHYILPLLSSGAGS